ncbi:MAG: hypothetical protein AABY73_09180 [Pseudomonadota bacterium]
MKPYRDVQPLLNAKNVISINLMRLRLRIRKVAPGYVSPPRFTKLEFKRRVAIRARTGWNCRG